MSIVNHVSEVREKIAKWLIMFGENESDVQKVEIEDLRKLAELFGFQTKIDEVSGSEAKQLVITPRDIKLEENTQQKDDAPQILLSPKKEPISPQIRSPINEEISVNVPSSSPKQQSKVSEALLKIINLAKDALENEGNSTFTKPAFLHKRISDIKISPMAMSTSGNHLTCDLNVTKTKESPTILRSTPKKKGAVIVKPSDKEKKGNVSVTFKKNVLQPVQSNLQALRSKLRTPTQMKSPSTLSARSTGAPISRISMPAERRLSTTPLKRDSPLGFSRLKYPSAIKK